MPTLSYRVCKQFLNNPSAAGISELRRKEFCENLTARVSCQNLYFKLKKLWFYAKVGPYQSFTAELYNTRCGIFLSLLAFYSKVMSYQLTFPVLCQCSIGSNTKVAVSCHNNEICYFYQSQCSVPVQTGRFISKTIESAGSHFLKQDP